MEHTGGRTDNCHASASSSENRDRSIHSPSSDLIEIQWQKTLGHIHQLFCDHESREAYTLRGCMRRNVKTIKDSRQCSGFTCQKSFSLLERPRDCARCRRVFCKRCTTYQRRLNYNGSYDVDGQLCKVCENCFSEGSQPIGQSRSHFNLFFLPERNKSKAKRQISVPRSHLEDAGVHLDKLNFDQECQRICDGFLAGMNKLGVGQVLSDVLGIIQPDWEKSTGLVYGKMAEQCSICKSEVKLLQRRYYCTICGTLVCNQCSTRDLIVYVPDDDDVELAAGSTAMAKLAIIKVLGCPPLEPIKVRYLRVCKACNERVQRRQIAEYQLEQQTVCAEFNSVETTWLLIASVNEKLRSIEFGINDNLPKYCELLDALDVGSTPSAVSVSYSSNMQVLAKAQGDISDHLTKFVTEVYSMKNLKPFTPGQTNILKKIIRAKRDYYSESMSQFRGLQRRLESIVPSETLTAIQNVVDTNTMNSCYVALKQLIYELLHACSKYRIEINLLPVLVQVEQVAANELRQCVVESWSEHERCVDELIKLNMAEHRYTRRLPTRRDDKIVVTVIDNRTRTVLEQILFQLNSKASAGKFASTKRALKMSMAAEVENEDENADWVFVQM